jgi:hypothetical protein
MRANDLGDAVLKSSSFLLPVRVKFGLIFENSDDDMKHFPHASHDSHHILDRDGG